jgi:hypothetical protein
MRLDVSPVNRLLWGWAPVLLGNHVLRLHLLGHLGRTGRRIAWPAISESKHVIVTKNCSQIHRRDELQLALSFAEEVCTALIACFLITNFQIKFRFMLLLVLEAIHFDAILPATVDPLVSLLKDILPPGALPCCCGG